MANAEAMHADTHSRRLFWGCFTAILATAFGFIARVLTAGEWGAEFGLSETQVGEILGAGLWPFAISIVLFSLVIDQIGYKAAMWFGFICQVVSTGIIFTAADYSMMYLGTFILALGSGTIEAYTNPLVATVFTRDKTTWLNRLHGGWAGGLVLGGVLAIAMGDMYWKYKIALVLIPAVIYLVLLLPEKFPVHERVLAGVSYKDMLAEAGALGAFIALTMVVLQIGQILGLASVVSWGIIVALTAGYGFYTKSLGRPLFILFLLIMIPLATTELGVDSWITSLMGGEMARIGINAGWVLVYTSAIMLVLRMFAGGLAHRVSPLGLMAGCSALAIVGLWLMSTATGTMILVAATLYGIAKTFFWPTTLAVVADQFPRGGALTMNTVAGVGMLAVGTLGAPFMGNLQDQNIDQNLSTQAPALHAQVMEPKSSLFGDYMGINPGAVAALPAAEQQQVAQVSEASQKEALRTIVILPTLMMLFYIGLIVYFRSRGGYRPAELGGATPTRPEPRVATPV